MSFRKSSWEQTPMVATGSFSGSLDVSIDSATAISADIKNLNPTAATLHQSAVGFIMADTTAGERLAGTVGFQKIIEWTGTASTIDSSFRIQVTRDNTLRNALEIDEFLVATLFGDLKIPAGAGLRRDQNSANSITIEVKNNDFSSTTLHQAAIQFVLVNTSVSQLMAARIKVQKEQEWTGTASTIDSTMILAVTANNNEVEALQILSTAEVNIINGGLTLGNPTGGDKGSGSLNVELDIYKNDTVYTDPDYVFEWQYLGAGKGSSVARPEYPGLRTLKEKEAYVKMHFHLESISRESSGIFERSNMVLENVEELHLHLFEHEARLDNLEERLERLENVRR